MGETDRRKVAEERKPRRNTPRRTPADTAMGFSEDHFRLAEVLAAFGQSEEVLRQLRASGTAPRGAYGALVGNPFFGDLRSDPRFQKIVREVEARREKIREEVRRLGIDLYPPGAEPDSAARAESAFR